MPCTRRSLSSACSLKRRLAARSTPLERRETFGSKCANAAFFSKVAAANGSGVASSTSLTWLAESRIACLRHGVASISGPDPCRSRNWRRVRAALSKKPKASATRMTLGRRTSTPIESVGATTPAITRAVSAKLASGCIRVSSGSSWSLRSRPRIIGLRKLKFRSRSPVARPQRKSAARVAGIRLRSSLRAPISLAPALLVIVRGRMAVMVVLRR